MYGNTNLAWSKQKSIGWNKLSLDVFAQLKEKWLFKMAKDPTRQRGNQSFGHKTALQVVIILQCKIYMLNLKVLSDMYHRDNNLKYEV